MTITPDILNRVAPGGKADIVGALASAFDTLLPAFGIDTPLRQAHFIGQCAVETASFRTLVEYGRGSGAAYGRYYGRGPLQLTWEKNYANMGQRLGLQLVAYPEAVATPVLGTLVACMFWMDHNLNRWSDEDQPRMVSRAINRGSANDERPANHEEERVAATQRAKGALGAGAAAGGMKLDMAQAALNSLGYQPPLAVDGKMGPKTRKALRAYQRERSLDETGELDAATVRDLTSRLIGG